MPLRIERFWTALENYWNGTILSTVEDTLQWAAKMTRHGFEPFVHFVEGFYPKKVKISKDELEPYKQQLIPDLVPLQLIIFGVAKLFISKI